MKMVKKIILLSLIGMLVSGCGIVEPTLKQEFEKEYERLEFKLSEELLKEFEYGLISSHDIVNKELYFTTSGGAYSEEPENILYKVDLEGNVSEVLKIDDTYSIFSVLIQGDRYYISSYEFSDYGTGSHNYKIEVYENSQKKEIISGSHLDFPVPKLSLIDGEIYTLVSDLGKDDLTDMLTRAIYLYNVTDEKIEETILENDGNNGLEKLRYFSINYDAINNMNDEVLFSVLREDEGGDLNSTVYKFDGTNIQSTEYAGPIPSDFLTIRDNIMYVVREDDNAALASGSIIRVSSKDNLKEFTETESDFYILKKIVDYKDGAVVYAFESNDVKQLVKTYYVTLEDGKPNFEELDIINYGESPILTKIVPHGFISTYYSDNGTIYVETIQEK